MKLSIITRFFELVYFVLFYIYIVKPKLARYLNLHITLTYIKRRIKGLKTKRTCETEVFIREQTTKLEQKEIEQFDFVKSLSFCQTDSLIKMTINLLIS